MNSVVLCKQDRFLKLFHNTPYHAQTVSRFEKTPQSAMLERLS